MRPINTTVGPLVAASATNIRTASAIGGAGAVTLNGSLVSGGVAILDTARRVLFTFAGDETGKSFVVTGTNWSGSSISETVSGTTPGTVATVLDYKTVTGVTASAASAGNVSIGTNSVAASPWVRFDDWGPQGVAIQCDVTGTVNATIQQSLDDPNDPVSPVAAADMKWISSADTAVVGFTANQQSNYNFAPLFARVLLNSGSGSVRAIFSQTGTPQR